MNEPKYIFCLGALDRRPVLEKLLHQQDLEVQLLFIQTPNDFSHELKQMSPVVVLVDHNWYKEFSEEISIPEYAGLPFVLLTRFGEENAAIDLLEKGFLDYVFYDRPGRLTAILRKLSKNPLFERKANVERLRQEISEKESILKELKENKEKLSIAQKIAKLGYWESDMEEEVLFWSDEVYSIWGRQKEGFKPSMNTFLDSIHPDDLACFQQEMAKALENAEDFDCEHRIILPNGKVKWVHERGKLTINRTGRTIFGGTVQDITDRKSFDEKLVLSEARNRGILRSQTNYLIRIDTTGRYSYCNDKFQNDFGWIYPQEELVGKLASTSVKEYHHELVHDVFKKCIGNPNQLIQAEIDKLTASGEPKTTWWDFICLTDANGDPLEIQAVGIDITDRVKAEKDLRESNQRYELVSKAASDAMYDWDVESGIIEWSETYCELFGYSRDFLKTHIEQWMEQIHPDDLHVLESLDAALKSEKESWKAEYRLRKVDGEYAYVNESGAIVRDDSGKAVRMVGAVQDISEKERSRQKLMLSEARHRGLIRSQTNYVIRTDYLGNYTYCNKKFVEEFGWIHGGEDIIGKSSIISIKEYHYRRIEEVVEKCMKAPGEVFQVELDKPGKNGRTRTTLWDIVFLAASKPEESEVQCIGIDITDRVQAEARMRFQADLLDKIGQAVIARDMQGRISYWNKAATEIYGWSREEAMGQDIKRIIPTSRTDEEQEEVIRDLEKGHPRSAEFTVRGKDGKEFPALVMDSPFIDENGILKGVVSISSDISERKQQETELKNYTMELLAANKGLEQFSFIVSHNLRAPLANLLGLADLLDQDVPQETREKLMQELLNNIKRLDEVVNDLNAILRVKSGINESKQNVDLLELIDSIKWSIDHIIQQEKVEIISDFSEQQEYATVKSYLHSIFFNLISNSIKYRQPEKRPVIKISSRKEADKLFIIFEDNGLGMDLEKRGDQLFGLYRRFHDHVEGKGMGLFMVKTQVEALGGKIFVESEKNKGSKFVLEFKNNSNLKHQNEEEVQAVYADR